jgi:hypothetical protein
MAIVASAAAALGVTRPVHAGTNGQQIIYAVSCVPNWSEAKGQNQNGDWKDHFYSTPATSTNQDGSCPTVPNQYPDQGWWFVGNVTVTGWVYYDGRNRSGDGAQLSCYVPPSQDGDWTTCQVP